MKRKFFCGAMVVVLLCISVLCCACGCKHEWQEATCEQAKTCTLCGKTDGEPLGHDWQEATATNPKTCIGCGTTEGKALSAWKLGYYVDDFNEKTDKSYVVGEFLGTFSNSATSGSKLKVYVYVNNKSTYRSFSFRLMEYGTKVQHFTKDDSVQLKIKEEDGSTYSYSLHGSGDLYLLSDAYYDAYKNFMNKLQSNQKINCYIVVKNTYIADDEYNFVITTGGLQELLNK